MTQLKWKWVNNTITTGDIDRSLKVCAKGALHNASDLTYLLIDITQGNVLPETLFTFDISHSKMVPLWVIDSEKRNSDETRMSLGLYGLAIPLLLWVSEPAVTGQAIWNRMETVAALYPEGFSREQIRSLCVGHLRQKKLFVDEDHHAQGSINFIRVNSTSTPLKEKVWSGKTLEQLESMVAASSPSSPPSLLNRLFEDEIIRVHARSTAILDLVRKGSTGTADESEAHKLGVALEKAIPCQRGESLPLLMATGKVKALLIDDDTAVLEQLQKACPDVAFLHVDPNKHTDAATKTTLVDWLQAQNQSMPGYFSQFDLVLLDLSFTSKPGAEPEGYQFIPVLRRLMPCAPIIVHSSYEDMGHIEKAFRCGATWYLPKKDSEKLQNHFIQMIQNPKWRKEYDHVTSKLPVSGSGHDALKSDCQKYLAVKAVEHLPGDAIVLHKLTGGISDAATLLARRAYGGNLFRVQPVIVKIDLFESMRLERVRYQRFIAPFVCNHAGRIEQPLIQAERHGAITYTFTGWAGMISQDRCDAKTVTLETLILSNLAGPDEGTLEFEAYRPMMERLFSQVMSALHDVDVAHARHESDFPNIALKEFNESVTHYLIRLPAQAAFSLGAPLQATPVDGIKVNENDSWGSTDSLDLYFLEAKADSDTLRCLVPFAGNDKDGKSICWRRVDLTGPMAGFYGTAFHMRAFMPLHASGLRYVSDSAASCWINLWGGKDKWKSTLAGGPFGEGEIALIPATMLSLHEWLSSDDAVRKCLNQGRVGVLHGDLNMRNIMAQQGISEKPLPLDDVVWLIDFAETRRDRIVFDYTQFEVDWFSRILHPAFFQISGGSGSARDVPWNDVLAFFRTFLDSGHKSPAVAENSRRLRFIYEGMQFIRNSAMRKHVGTEEYTYSRIFALLIAHKIYVGRIAGQKTGPELDLYKFKAQLLLKLAFQTAEHAGWQPPRLIRVSCSALCRIKLDDKYLLEVNRSRGNVLTPIGGALTFAEDTRPMLEKWNCEQLERGSDLRMQIPRECLSAFIDWFKLRQGRETDPCREVIEELVNEHRAIDSLAVPDINFSLYGKKESFRYTTKPGKANQLTFYLVEYFDVTLPPAMLESLRNQMEQNESSRLRLLSGAEIRSFQQEGMTIAETSFDMLEANVAPASGV